MSGGFRSDIQGLRALAVVIVVLFHADVPGFAGGFVGVDVFFVISGYVIGASLLRELDASGRIELTGFYKRRVRRLMPAYLAAAAFCWLVVAVAVPIGAAQVAAARTGLWSAFSAANIQLLLSPQSYFSPDERLNPFLHTWSLGIEEQFYLAVPALLAGAAIVALRRGVGQRKLLGVLVGVLTGLSLAAAVAVAAGGDTHRAFYHPGLRFWEIGAGMLLSMMPVVQLSIAVRSICATASVAIIAWSTVTFGELTVFPGASAVPVVAGTAMLIYCVEGTYLTRILAASGARWLGDRSYGWYLWHWPVIVLVELEWSSSWIVLTAASLVALGPAAVSYQLLEQPLRIRKPAPGRKVLAGFLAALVVSVSVGVGVTNASASDWWIEVDRPQRGRFESGCEAPDRLEEARTPCYSPVPGGELVLLVGDSHAGALADGFVVGANDAGYSVLVAAKSACPFLDLEMADDTERCASHRERLWRIIENVRPAAVVVAHDSAGYVARVSRDPLIRLDGQLLTSPEAVADVWTRQLRTTRERLDELLVAPISVDVVPTWVGVYQDTEPTLLERDPRELVMTLEELADQRSAIIRREHQVLGPGQWLDPAEVLCAEGICSSLTADGHARWADESHLSIRGSLELADWIATALPAALAQNGSASD